MPQRVQLSRGKGWKMPDNTVKVDRNLACWCPAGGPCHAELLLALANPD